MTSYATQPATLVVALFDEIVASFTRGAAQLFDMTILEMRRRKAARELRELDDRMLADVGLHRCEIDRIVRYGRDDFIRTGM